jgi:transcriptional regulator with XRE-family HTH domain
MSPRKLTAADKKEIVKVYRSSTDSTAALAARYGVSNSTVSRLLKSHIPEEEYEVLLSEKRHQKADFSEEATLIDLPPGPDEETLDESTLEDLPQTGQQLVLPVNGQPKPVKQNPAQELRRVRRRSSALLDNDLETATHEQTGATPKPVIKSQKATPVAPTPVLPAELTPLLVTELGDEEDDQEDLSAIASILGEEMGDLLDEEEEEDEEDFGDEDDWSEPMIPTVMATENLQVQVLPLSAANLPRTCYIVIDKFAELVAKPLRDFAELGKIPTEEVPQRTLPIFDNHRVAKRFSSSHTHRVIKVPDSRLFQKTTRHLAAKGITRLLVDGQIYSLH